MPEPPYFKRIQASLQTHTKVFHPVSITRNVVQYVAAVDTSCSPLYSVLQPSGEHWMARA